MTEEITETKETTTPTYSPEMTELMAKKSWKTDADAAKGYMELEKFKGMPDAEHIAIPKDGDPKIMETIYNKLGRPESPDKYKFETKSKVPIDPETMKEFSQFAHKNGLNQKQYNDIVNYQLSLVEKGQKMMAELTAKEKAEGEKVLREKFGADYDTSMVEIDKTMDKLKVTEVAKEEGVYDKPWFRAMFHDISKLVNEAGLPEKGKDGSDTKTSTERIEEIQKDPAFKDKLNPKHETIMNEWLVLHGVKIN